MLPRNRFASERYNSPVVDSDSPFFLAISSSWIVAFILLTLEYLCLPYLASYFAPSTLHTLATSSNFLRSKLLILGLLNRLTLLKARLQMGDVDFSHVLQDRRLLDAEGYHGICRLPFGFFSTGLKSVVLLHTRMLERKWKIQSMRFSKPVVHQTFAYSSVLRCSSAD